MRLNVKRYRNRKYYCKRIENSEESYKQFIKIMYSIYPIFSGTSKYLTFKDLQALLVNGFNLSITEKNKDKTLETYLAMILQNEKKTVNKAPSEVLCDIIREGGLRSFLSSRFEKDKSFKIDFNEEKSLNK